MLQIMTSLTLLARLDLTADAWTLASGVTGTFVSFGGNGDIVKPTAGDFAVPVWNESARNLQTGVWSPDVLATGKVTVMYGKLRAVTDQFTGTPAVGEKLYVDADGKLTTSSAGKAIPIAICTKASHTSTYMSRQFTAIEFVTL